MVLARRIDSRVVKLVVCRKRARGNDSGPWAWCAGSMLGRTSIVELVGRRGCVRDWIVGIVSMRRPSRFVLEISLSSVIFEQRQMCSSRSLREMSLLERCCGSLRAQICVYAYVRAPSHSSHSSLAQSGMVDVSSSRGLQMCSPGWQHRCLMSARDERFPFCLAAVSIAVAQALWQRPQGSKTDPTDVSQQRDGL